LTERRGQDVITSPGTTSGAARACAGDVCSPRDRLGVIGRADEVQPPLGTRSHARLGRLHGAAPDAS